MKRLAAAVVALLALGTVLPLASTHHDRPAPVAPVPSPLIASAPATTPRPAPSAASRTRTAATRVNAAPTSPAKDPHDPRLWRGVPARVAALDWPRLAHCESTSNPRAVDPTGTYRGLYQFDLRTWRSVGGTGDPIDATAAEQTLRAQRLYLARGRAPWPTCGALL